MKCPHCDPYQNKRDLPEDCFYCPYCGRGVNPIPCEHYPDVPADAHPNHLPLPDLVSPESEVTEDGFRVFCTKCKISTHHWARSRWAFDEWNRFLHGYYSDHWIPPRWKEEDES